MYTFKWNTLYDVEMCIYKLQGEIMTLTKYTYLLYILYAGAKADPVNYVCTHA